MSDARLALRHLSRFRPFSLEELLTAPDLFGLTEATPLQRALCRVLDGEPLRELKEHPDVLEAIGDCSAIDGKRPFELIHLSAIRGAKSLISMAAAFYLAVTVDMSFVRRGGEHGTVSILSVSLRTARPTLQHLHSIEQKPELARFLMKEPRAESLCIRNAHDIPVDIDVVAGSKSGGNMIGRWQVAVIFEEAPRMNGTEDGVINWTEQHEAIYGRIVPGGQILSIGSPTGKIGPIYDLVERHWKAPTPALVVVRARGDQLNPSWWTPKRIAYVKEHQPNAYVTDFLAQFSDSDETLFPAGALFKAQRVAPASLPFEPRQSYRAAIDPALTGNAWTLIVATRRDKKRIVAHAEQWQGTKGAPLSIRFTLARIAEICAKYDITNLETDRHLAAAIIQLGKEAGLTIYPSELTDPEITERYISLAALVAVGDVELAPDPMLRMDLQRVRKVPRAGFGSTIQLPVTSDGRHCDYAPAMILALGGWLKDEELEELMPGTPEYQRVAKLMEAQEGDRVRRERFAEVAKRNSDREKAFKFTGGRSR